MVGCELRMVFDFMTVEQKNGLKKLCQKYDVKPVCRYAGGDCENMSFGFGDNVGTRDEFIIEIGELFGIKSRGTKRKVYGHRINCPL